MFAIDMSPWTAIKVHHLEDDFSLANVRTFVGNSSIYEHDDMNFEMNLYKHLEKRLLAKGEFDIAACLVKNWKKP